MSYILNLYSIYSMLMVRTRSIVIKDVKLAPTIGDHVRGWCMDFYQDRGRGRAQRVNLDIRWAKVASPKPKINHNKWAY